MTQLSGFMREGFAAVRDALDDAVARANLHLRPETITKAAARRVRATLKLLETLLRRLLVLMAAELTLDPVRERGDREHAPNPRKRQRGFVLMPVWRSDLLRLEGLETGYPGLSRNHTGTSLLLDRVSRLRALIENPHTAAKRMARMLARLKREGALRPMALPQTGLHRQRPELGLVASILPQMIGEALSGWYDTS